MEDTTAQQPLPLDGPYKAVHDQIEAKLAEFGSIDRWPTLSLLPEQFYLCECGARRSQHKQAGTQRMGCPKTKCIEFKAPIVAPERKRKAS